MALWQCSWLYQCTNCVTQRRACSNPLNGLTGIWGRYFSVLNRASEYGLSLLTAGLLRDAAAFPLSWASRCPSERLKQTFLPTPRMQLRLGHAVRLVQRKQALGRTPRWRRHIVRKLRFTMAHLSLSVELTEPLLQSANHHIQISGYILNATSTLLPDFAQGPFLELN